ncbi:MAG TPA: IPT/TIG domain-containing protein [Vulgatibacter sp.]|nr:IPT/TIG domain-containing protein [Vulgatibacter sp.]
MIRSWSFCFLAFVLSAAAFGCGGAGPEGGAGDPPGGKPHERPGTGGSGGSGGAGGSGGGEGGTGGSGFEIRLDAVRPPRGGMAGGEVLVLSGRGFAGHGVVRVEVGSNPSLGARVLDDETILAEAPPGLAGPVDVKVIAGEQTTICAGCYRYLGGLTLSGIEPAEGSVRGGDRIVLRGEGFGASMTVTIGRRAALDVTAIDDRTLEAILPPGDEPGAADVRVFDEEGQASLRKAFTYLAPLRLDAVDPPGGPLAGGGRVWVHGAGFDRGAHLVLGGVPLATRWESSERLSALVPEGDAVGAVPLEVVTARGTLSARYAYLGPCEGGPPRILAISPERGGTDGGQEIALAGSCLDDDKLALRMGGAFAADAFADGPGLVRAVTPPAPAGTVDVELRVASGADVLPDAFRYVSLPAIASVTPSSGDVGGGTSITVTGSGFPPGARLFVGALEATDVVRVGDGRITARTPRGTDGPVPVRIVDPQDPELEAILADGFRYEGPLALAAVEPTVGSRAGGTRVTLRGAGFRDGMTVTFGDAAASDLEVLDPFTAVVRSPRGDTGIVDVSVSRPGSPSALRLGAYSYVDPGSTTGGASGGPLTGSLNVTVLEGSASTFGAPVPGATVSLGNEDGVALSGVTDDRGQVTLSSPLLVKPQIVSVHLAGFEGATIVGQRSENLTVLLQRNAGGDDGDGGIPWVRVATIEGRVWGFKLPPNRMLGPGETEVAKVSYSAESVYHAPPFGYGNPEWTVLEEGGTFRMEITQPRHMAIHATYGIQRADGTFERLAMGVTRNLNPIPDQKVVADVIIDTHLDAEAPVTVQNAPAGHAEVFAFVDLGGEGVIPVGSATVSSTFGAASGRLVSLPRLSAGSFLFEAWGMSGRTGLPLTVGFRRQSGSLDAGITLGPLLGLTSITKWPGEDGIVEWSRRYGPTPEVVYALIETSGGTPVWHAVLPGTEQRFAIPPPVMDKVRAQFHGAQLRMTLVQGAEPRFDFGQWGYADMGLNAYTSFTYDSFTFWL